MIENELMRLRREHVKPAAAMLARAFAHDPKMAFFVGGEAGMAALSPHVLEFEIRYGLRYGEVYATSSRLEGVAVRLPGNRAEVTLLRGILAGGMRFRRNVGTEAFNRTIAFGDYIDKLHKRLVPGRHWYLFFVGVDPEYQGKGYASRLIRPMLERFGREGMPCYLITESERNVPLYEHLGFRIIDHAGVPETGVDDWAMLHAAKCAAPGPG